MNVLLYNYHVFSTLPLQVKSNYDFCKNQLYLPKY